MIPLVGDFPGEYRNNALIDSVDASQAVFHQRHGTSDNDYPFNVYGSGGSASRNLTLIGGKILGGVPTGDWRTLYDAPNGNSAALQVTDCPEVKIKGWYFGSDPALSQPRFVWDAIRLRGTTDNYVIEDVFIDGCRDDALELEHGSAGIIRNSRFFNVFVFLATHGLNAGGKIMRVEDCLVSMGLHSYKGRQTHQSPFKANTDDPDYNPNFSLSNVVVAIRDPTHEGGVGSRLQYAFERMEAVNCYFLNLNTNVSLSQNYLAMIPAGFTILEGETALNYWDQRVAAWGEPPLPEDPTLQELHAAVEALEMRLASIEAAVAANTQAIENITMPDLSGINNELLRLDKRLDDISAASAD
jgi:hypothetical protein